MGNKFQKFDHINKLPDEILEHIFNCLMFHEVIPLLKVCKRWNGIVSSDHVWSRFVPKYPHMSLPEALTPKECFKLLWDESIRIGKERWYPNPIPELNLHEEILQRARVIQYGSISPKTKTVLMIRLNPYYDFTINPYQRLVSCPNFNFKPFELAGRMLPRMLSSRDEVVNAVDKIFKTFKVSDLCHADNIQSATDVLKRARTWDQLRVKNKVWQLLEPDWFLAHYGLEGHRVHKNEEITLGISDIDRMQTDDNASSPSISDAVEIYENELKIKNKMKYSQVMERLYSGIKNILIDTSSPFVWLPLDNGCFSGSENCSQLILVGDKAVIFEMNIYV